MTDGHSGASTSTSAGARPYAAEEIAPSWSEQLLDWGQDFHDLLLGDELRMRAYRQAIFEVVRSGDVVLDLGTGTGVLARWAIEAGAARAYGIERDPELLGQATARARDEGMDDRFVPVAGLSSEVELPERVDVLVSEILGNLVDNEACTQILDDAARRFLAPRGRLLPRRAERYLVPVEAPLAHDAIGRLDGEDGKDGASGHRSPFDAYYDVILPLTCYLASPRCSRAFRLVGDPTTYTDELVFAVQRPGALTGFKGWFVADLSPTVVLDISGDHIELGSPTHTASDSWRHAYLPVERPIAVEPHDRVALRLSRGAVASGSSGVFAQSYQWEGTVHRGDHVVARFDQRT